MVLRETFLDKYRNKQDLNIAVLKTGTTLSELCKQVGKGETITVVAIMLRNFCAQYNVSKNMTQSQIEDYAADLVLDYAERRGVSDHLPPEMEAWKLEEYAIFFDRAGKGDFGVPFDRIDRGVIEQMFEQYMAERNAARWELEQEEVTRRWQTPNIHPRVSEYLPEEKRARTINDLTTNSEKNAILDPLAQLRAKYGPEADAGNNAGAGN